MPSKLKAPLPCRLDDAFSLDHFFFGGSYSNSTPNIQNSSDDDTYTLPSPILTRLGSEVSASLRWCSAELATHTHRSTMKSPTRSPPHTALCSCSHVQAMRVPNLLNGGCVELGTRLGILQRPRHTQPRCSRPTTT